MSFGQPRYVPEEWVRVRCRSRMGTERSGGSCKRVPFQNLSSVKRLSAHVRAAEKGAGTPTRVSVRGHHVVVCKMLLMFRSFIFSPSTIHCHHGTAHITEPQQKKGSCNSGRTCPPRRRMHAHSLDVPTSFDQTRHETRKPIRGGKLLRVS